MEKRCDRCSHCVYLNRWKCDLGCWQFELYRQVDCDEYKEKTKKIHKPAITVHPGSILKEELKARKIRPRTFARECEMDFKTLEAILKGLAPMTDGIAEILEQHLDISAKTWMKLQKSYEDNI